MKRIAYLLLVLLLVLPLAACENGNDAVSGSASQTESATEAPVTEAPAAETKAPADTEEPVDPRVESAWPEAERICALYGLDIKKEDNKVSPTPPSSCTVLFFAPDDDSTEKVMIYLEKDESEAWQVTGRRLELQLTADDGIDIEKLESDQAELKWPELDFTEAELSEAGFGTEPADAAAYAAELMAKRFIECSEDNYLKCKKAAVVSQRQKGDTNAYDTRMAMLPENAKCFMGSYGDILGSLYAHAEGEEELADFDLCITIYLNVNVERNGDGSYHTYVDFLE